MSTQEHDTDRDIGHGLRLRIPQSWQVESDANGTLVRDPATGLSLRVFCKPSAKGAVALERFAELGLGHLTKTLPDCERMGAWQREEGQGWQGRVQMMSRAAEGKEFSRLLYTAFILADESDPARQNNVSVLLEVPGEVFKARAGYFRFLVPSRLLTAKHIAAAVSSTLKASAVSANLSAQAAAPSPAQSATQPSDQIAAISREDDLDLAARGQKLVIYSIVLNFILNAVQRGVPGLPAPVLLAMAFVVTGFTINGVIKICSGLGKSQGSKLAFMVAAVFPLINLVTLVYLSLKATKVLRAAGWSVGLMGARE
jgi:hypothetical protein